MRKIAVILFNLGGPDSPEAVQPFLFNLFNDKAIIGAPQPIRWLIAKLISTRRAPIAQDIYKELGGKSPLLENTEAQAKALEETLRTTHPNQFFRCFISMRYWHPMAAETAAAVRDWNADEVVMLPLYPQFSTTTTGSSVESWQKALVKSGWTGEVRGICCYPENDGFVDAVTARLRAELLDIDKVETVRLMFSAHGLPQKVVDGGDPYQLAVERTAAAVVARLDVPAIDWIVSYQSRVGPLEWIKPYTEDEIRRAGSEGKGLIVVPIAFVSEHSETLVELDIEYRKLAEESGVPIYRRVGTVAEDSAFISGLSSLVGDALARTPGLMGSEGSRACPASCARCPISA